MRRKTQTQLDYLRRRVADLNDTVKGRERYGISYDDGLVHRVRRLEHDPAPPVLALELTFTGTTADMVSKRIKRWLYTGQTPQRVTAQPHHTITFSGPTPEAIREQVLAYATRNRLL
jgi:hypothetical protein